MRDNERMTSPELAPRRPFGGIVAVWVFAAVAGIAIIVFVPAAWRATWMTLALAASLLLGFAIQLAYGRAQRFIQRMALSTVGALIVLGILSVGLGLASVVSLIS
jgi:drug/metabolite transporter (DMT)-like permease